MVEAAEFYLMAEDEKNARNSDNQLSSSAIHTLNSRPLSDTQCPAPFSFNPTPTPTSLRNQGFGTAHSFLETSSSPARSAYSDNSFSLNNSNTVPQQRVSTALTAVITPSKAPSQTLKWLMDNFEGCEGVSLPRATLFALYMQHCAECELEPMNAASFGKMIRSIFSGLRTRRLGTRGNSKYHYYGIKLKQMSSLHKRLADICSQLSPAPCLSDHTEKRQRSGVQKHLSEIRDFKQESFSRTMSDRNFKSCKRSPFKVPMKIPDIKKFELINSVELSNFSKEEINQFCTLYAEHFEASVSAINNSQFDYLCAIWNAFWRNPTIDVTNASYKIIEQRLPRTVFNNLCQQKPIVDFIFDSDSRFYQKYADYIFPDVFCSFDDVMVLNLKNATIDMQTILNTSIIHLPEEVIKAKKRALENFLTHLKDMSSMCHSIESVKAIFRSKSCLNQAQSDFMMIDSEDIKKRLKSLLPHCEEQFEKFELFIFKFFGSQSALCSNASGTNDHLVIQLLSHAESFLVNTSARLYQSSAVASASNEAFQWPQKLREMREVYVSWCLYSSMLLREMTLRGACSFGIFQLVRTLLDDYLLYVLKNSVAHYSGLPMVGAIGDLTLGGVAGGPSDFSQLY